MQGALSLTGRMVRAAKEAGISLWMGGTCPARGGVSAVGAWLLLAGSGLRGNGVAGVIG